MLPRCFTIPLTASLAVALLLPACDGADNCIPNDQFTCDCPMGKQGIQSCLDDGSGFTECDCSPAVIGGGGSGGANACADTCPDEECCDGECKDLATNVLNCGLCGKACPGINTPNTQAVCDNATCSLFCFGDNHDCDGDPANGCEYTGPCQ